MKIFNLILFIGIITIISCNKDATILENKDQVSPIGFTKSELATVGTLHNQYVTEVYQNIDFLKCVDCTDEVLAGFANIDIDLTHHSN